MANTKKLGVFMDHSSAHLIEFMTEPSESKNIESNFTHQEKEHSLTKGEHTMHNKEQQFQSEYYRKLGEVIKNYEEVLLFGPTNAKTELFNILSADNHFANIKIDLKQTDKMTINQEHAFVNEHFSK